MKQKMEELQKEMKRSTIVVKHVNRTFPIINKSRRKKVSKDVALNDEINKLDLIDMHRSLIIST